MRLYQSGGTRGKPLFASAFPCLSEELLPLERKTAVRLRNEGRINDEVLRKIEHELDLSESRLALS
jgi:CPA1 family monovalent cation:H+ antiporter